MENHPPNTYKELSKIISPVILSSEWPLFGRLIFISFFASFGTIVNGFFISAFFVERRLRKRGNVYLAFMGFCDLVLTGVVMPISAMVILSSGEWDTVQVCNFIHATTAASTYCYSLFFMLAAVESYFRLCKSSEEYQAFLALDVGVVSVLVIIIGITLAWFGIYENLDYDYCERNFMGDFYFKLITFCAMFGTPAGVTIICLVLAPVGVHYRARSHSQYKRSQLYDRDNSTTHLNILSYVLFILFWTPYMIVVLQFPLTAHNKFYYSAWFALLRPVFSNLIYSVSNRNFRRAFSYLFYYCFFKTTDSRNFNNRNRRALNYMNRPFNGNVNVHMMQQAVTARSPPRGSRATSASLTQETQNL